MSLLMPFLLIIIFSISISLILKYNAIESLFLSLTAIIILLMVLIYFFEVSVAIIIMLIIMGLSAILSIILSIRDKSFLQGLTSYFNNPALVVFLLSVSFYSFIMYDKHLFVWDDYSHWGLAVKAIMEFGGYDIAPKILGDQTLGMPVLNVFITKIAGPKEGYMFCGMWFVYWASLLLPVSGLKWRRYKTIVFYSIVIYSVLMLLTHSYKPNLYNDAMLSIISGSLAGYYFLFKNRTKNYKWILLSGLILLVHIKRVVGLFFAIVVLSIYIYEYVADKQKRNRQNLAYIIISSVSIALSFVLYKIVLARYKIVVQTKGVSWCDPIGSILSAVKSPIGIGLLLLFAALCVLAFIQFKKKRKLPLLNISALASFVLFCMYLFIKLDGGTMALINAFIKNAARIELHDCPGYVLIGISLTICAGLYYVSIKNEYKKKYRHISILFITQGMLYCGLLLASYTQFSEGEALSSASLSRYLSSFIFYVLIAFIGVFSVKEDLLINYKTKIKCSIAALIFVFAFIMPKPLTLFYFEYKTIYEYTYNYEAQMYSYPVKAYTGNDDKTYVIAQGDSGFMKFLMQYYCLPRVALSKYWSLGPSKYEGDIWSKDISMQEFAEILVDDGYDYLFLYDIDDYLVETYAGLFQSPSEIAEGKLYKINVQDGKVLLSLVNGE